MVSYFLKPVISRSICNILMYQSDMSICQLCSFLKHVHFMFVTVRIVHPDSRRECMQGCVGEIWVSSDSTARGYFRDAAGSREIFFQQCTYLNGEESYFEYMRSGDSGFLLDRELFVVGRMKDMIIVRGRNYYPQDFESTVEKVEGVRPGCSAVFSVEVDGSERLCVAAEVRDNIAKAQSGRSMSVLISALRGALLFMHIFTLQFVESKNSHRIYITSVFIGFMKSSPSDPPARKALTDIAAQVG